MAGRPRAGRAGSGNFSVREALGGGESKRLRSVVLSGCLERTVLGVAGEAVEAVGEDAGGPA